MIRLFALVRRFGLGALGCGARFQRRWCIPEVQGGDPALRGLTRPVKRMAALVLPGTQRGAAATDGHPPDSMAIRSRVASVVRPARTPSADMRRAAASLTGSAGVLAPCDRRSMSLAALAPVAAAGMAHALAPLRGYAPALRIAELGGHVPVPVQAGAAATGTGPMAEPGAVQAAAVDAPERRSKWPVS